MTRTSREVQQEIRATISAIREARRKVGGAEYAGLPSAQERRDELRRLQEKLDDLKRELRGME